MMNPPYSPTLAALFLVLTGATNAQIGPPYVPPDFFGDEHEGRFVLRHNAGQVLDTEGDQRPDVKYYFENSPIGIWLKEKSKISFTLAAHHADTLAADTLYRVDMQLSKTREVNPVALYDAPGITNYYRGTIAAEGVSAKHRAVYSNIADNIDAHFYGSRGGPRIAFVIRPGGNPSHIGLAFSGQDSLGIDWQGALKLYKGGRWIKLEEARAYQVSLAGTLVPVNWNAGYVNQSGTATVSFTFGTYNPFLPLVLQIGYPPLPNNAGGGQDNLTWSTSAGRDVGYTLDDFILGGENLPDNDLIVTGATADMFFPANPGLSFPVQNRDVFVSRFDYAPGDDEHDAELLWTTFISGSNYDVPASIFYSSEHDLIYVGGWTNSTGWPMIPDANPSDGSFYQSTRKGERDGFVCRLEPTLGDLVRSTLYGGSGDDIITTLTADAFGRVFCFGVTSSTTGSYNDCNSPTSGLPLCDPNTNNHQQDNNAGGLDMFVARFNEDFELTWGSFIGGGGDDRVFDSDYLPGPNSTYDRIALAGSTTGTLPYGSTGAFQLNSGGPCGFVWLFNSDGRPTWGTHVNGTINLQAVSLGKNDVRVMGLTEDGWNANATNTCAAVPGALSICGGDDEIEYFEHYIAEFSLATHALDWSTVQGGLIDGTAYTAADRYYEAIWLLHDMYRYMDIRTDGDDHFMVMGMVAQAGEGMISDYPTVPYAGMYHKPYDAAMGNEQTDVFISIYTPDHVLLWSTMFGSSFQHVVSSPAGFEDWYWLNRGCDFGHDIVWVEDEVLYLVGTTGGYNYDRQCPYPSPGPSYCELTAGPLNDAVDAFDGMIARFDLREIGIGMRERQFGAGGSLLTYPSPVQDHLNLKAPDWADGNCIVLVVDATGRNVLTFPYSKNSVIDVADLAGGTYTVMLRNLSSGQWVSANFVRL